eukprot:GHVN01041220.1.p1 GENE.GHVN01041220.1~~GHVN01041220.1.p1  ORF type:complete len:602 (+),score=77.69 GHVN01041220.1:906-2711(+)
MGRSGATSGTRFTGVRTCSATCVMSEWEEWSKCSQSCGFEGERTRQRTLVHKPAQDDWYDTYQVHNTPREGDNECEDMETETQPCKRNHCPVDCEWADWEPLVIDDDWRNSTLFCDAECGGGFAYRHRAVVIHGAHGGKECDLESSVDAVPCNEQLCPGCHVTEWGPWSECSATCETGSISRTREKVPDADWADGCDDLVKLEDKIPCTAGGNMEPVICPKDCEVEPDWGDWSDCTKSCGAGIFLSTRLIIQWNQGSSTHICGERITDDNGDVLFDYTFERLAPCNEYTCPRDCEVSDWSDWSNCVAPDCGRGYAFRTRGIVVPPAGDGAECGPLSEEVVCDGPPPPDGTDCPLYSMGCYETGEMIVGTPLMEGPATVEQCQTMCSDYKPEEEGDSTTCVGWNLNTRLNYCELFSHIDHKTKEGDETVFILSGGPTCDSGGGGEGGLPIIPGPEEPPIDGGPGDGGNGGENGGGGGNGGGGENGGGGGTEGGGENGGGGGNGGGGENGGGGDGDGDGAGEEDEVPVGIIVGATVGSLAILGAAGGAAYMVTRNSAADEDEMGELAGGDRMLIQTKDFAEIIDEEEEETNVRTEEVDSDGSE